MLRFCLKKQTKNLLPKKILNGEAPTSRFSKKSRKVLKRFKRLTKLSSKFTLVALILFFFSGYYPAWSFPPIKPAHVKALNSSEQSQQILASSFPQPVILPHQGYVSTKFSNWHPGVDIATSLGTPIHPITQGVIKEVNMGFLGYGNHVIISHQNNFTSLYGHMGKIFVKVGQDVTTDTILGEVGLTGFTSGPHTHLEITHDGKYIDPLLLIPQISDIPKPEYITKQSLPPR